MQFCLGTGIRVRVLRVRVFFSVWVRVRVFFSKISHSSANSLNFCCTETSSVGCLLFVYNSFFFHFPAIRMIMSAINTCVCSVNTWNLVENWILFGPMLKCKTK